ncbi:hypothetical protein San01_13650 [Streptomyces angustmyceticus]|uniref:Uncharacterized protein n=1 Tax=Streptomyces angustmyceticus TaxID=285578 RepID=A0A5J4LE01_9ACTN|nr:hypothetical protein San01_13650 [Streptomyces angustmyceticus]
MAYATEESGSLQKIGSASRFGSSVSPSRVLSSGRPTIIRFGLKNWLIGGQTRGRPAGAEGGSRCRRASRPRARRPLRRPPAGPVRAGADRVWMPPAPVSFPRPPRTA